MIMLENKSINHTRNSQGPEYDRLPEQTHVDMFSTILLVDFEEASKCKVGAPAALAFYPPLETVVNLEGER